MVKGIILELRECSWGQDLSFYDPKWVQTCGMPPWGICLDHLHPRLPSCYCLSVLSRSLLLLPWWAHGFETYVILTNNGPCHLQPSILRSWMSACLGHISATIQKSHLSVLQKYAELFILHNDQHEATMASMPITINILSVLASTALLTTDTFPGPTELWWEELYSWSVDKLGHLEYFLPRSPQEHANLNKQQGGVTTLDQLTKPVPTKPPQQCPTPCLHQLTNCNCGCNMLVTCYLNTNVA